MSLKVYCVCKLRQQCRLFYALIALTCVYIVAITARFDLNITTQLGREALYYTMTGLSIVIHPDTNTDVYQQRRRTTTTKEAELSMSYLLPVSKRRLTRLFDVLASHENKQRQVLEQLGILMFNSSATSTQPKKRFVRYLKNVSQQYTFNRLTNLTSSSTSINAKPLVILLAADAVFYRVMQAAVYHVHRYFTGVPYHLIVYDLGLTKSQLLSTLDKCKCELRRFNAEYYAQWAPHVVKLKTYSWKPLIIQEVLKEYETVLYMDSSIRFLSANVSHLMEPLKRLGMRGIYLNDGGSLTCYTHSATFRWFRDAPLAYTRVKSMDANILLWHRNAVSRLVMKAWVQCALHASCIAPEGASVHGCCGCHRFDQSALTIITSYFYGVPESREFLPAYAMRHFGSHNETFFYKLMRGHKMNYFYYDYEDFNKE